MRECLDQNTLQCYFDGELSPRRLERVRSHLLSCASCAAALHEIEIQSSLLADALTPELSSSIPTEQLRSQIELAIATHKHIQPFAARTMCRSWLESIGNDYKSALPSPAGPMGRAFCSAALVLTLGVGAILVIRHLRGNIEPNITSQQIVVNSSSRSTAPAVDSSDSAVKTSLISRKGNAVKARNPVRSALRFRGFRERQVELIPGERSYLEVIAKLDSTIKSEPPMRPALRVEYERNLALIDRALAATRNAVKNNPNNPDTAELMFAAYQTKIDLLNTVADARVYNRQR